MIKNRIEKVESEIASIHVAHPNKERRVWATKVDPDNTYILYATRLNEEWEVLIDSKGYEMIQSSSLLDGKNFGVTWWSDRGNGLSTYADTSVNKKTVRLHQFLLAADKTDTIHHIDGVPHDNRFQNLQRLDSHFHNGVKHATFDEKKFIFEDPQKNLRVLRDMEIDAFIFEYLAHNDTKVQQEYISLIYSLNPNLTKEILARLKIHYEAYKNFYKPHPGVYLNPHLSSDYLDFFELKDVIKTQRKKHREKILFKDGSIQQTLF